MRKLVLSLFTLFLVFGMLISPLAFAKEDDTDSRDSSSENSEDSTIEIDLSSNAEVSDDDEDDSKIERDEKPSERIKREQRERAERRNKLIEVRKTEREFKHEIREADGKRIEVERKIELNDDGEVKIKIIRKIVYADGTVRKITIIIEKDGDDTTKKKIKIEGFEDFDVETELEINDSLDGNESEIDATASNGKKVKLHVLPDQASEIAKERLRTKNFSVDLREIQHKNIPAVVYHIEADKKGRFLGIFKKSVKVQTEIDPETGDIVTLSKPWWAFLVSGEDSDQTGDDTGTTETNTPETNTPVINGSENVSDTHEANVSGDDNASA